MTAPIDYNAVLADLEAKRSQIDAAIAVIRSLVAGGGGDMGGAAISGDDAAAAITSPGVTARVGSAIQTDSFFGMSTSQAVRKFLNMMKRPQTPKAIAEALIQGGQVHSVDYDTTYRNVYTALTRSKDFVKTRTKDWGLTEWYGNKPKADAE